MCSAGTEGATAKPDAFGDGPLPYRYDSSFFPAALHGYPCTASSFQGRTIFILQRPMAYLTGVWDLARTGELWVPTCTYLILFHLAAVLLMQQQRLYVRWVHPVCTVCIGLAPKVCTLVAMLKPATSRMPSTYFTWYLPYEGAITGWQLWVYQVGRLTASLLRMASCKAHALRAVVCWS